MKQSLGNKPIIYPQPVLIIATYNEDGSANAMNAAWGCVCDYTKVSIIIDRNHHTTKNLLNKKAFTVSIADVERLKESDYFGLASGKDVKDKVKAVGLTYSKSENVDAPIINEYPLTLECKLVSFEDKTERVIGEVVNTFADESILTDGKIDLAKFHPITYDSVNHHYVALGEKVGNAFKDGNIFK